MKYLVRLFAPFFAAAGLCAQHEAPDTFGHSRHGEAFDEGPRQAAYLMDGISDQVHMPVAGLSKEAQAFFDQGLCQLHGFWYFESERSFRQVAKLQPECAMAYWGMAMANVESPERAAGFVANAVRRSAGVPRYEQLWVDALASYYQIDEAATKELRSGDPERVKAAVAALVGKAKERTGKEKEKLDKQLLKDFGTVVYEFPEDTEAKALLAVQIWLAYEWGGGIPITSHTAIDSLLSQVFAAAPRHPAHHYRVHLWDQEDAKRALQSAAALGDSAPGIAHQWHMAGHIYAKLNRHAEASWQQAASGRVDHAHMQRDGVMPFLIHNYGHNQEWLSRSLSLQGRVDEAIATAKNLVELPRHPKWNRLEERGDIANYGRLRLATICEDHDLWQTAFDLQRDGYLEPGEDVDGEVVRLGLLGRAAFRLGRFDTAERLVTEVQALLPRARLARAQAIDKAEDEALAAGKDRKKTDEALDEARRRSTDDVRAVRDLLAELDAERQLANGQAKEAAAAFAKIDRFPETLLADAYLAAGDAKAAINALEAEVKKRPNRMPTLGRLVLAYRAANDPDNAGKLREREAELATMHGASGPLARRLGMPAPRAVTVADFAPDFGTRPELSTLGPADWSPMPAVGFDLPVAGGGRRTLAGQRGKPTLVVFYLGFGCLHCIEQLQALGPKAGAFAAAGIDILAIGSDTAAKAAESLAALSPEERFPFPLLADPQLAAFKAWRCYDDFEEMPLHGTFLVDAAGKVRWQDISYEPFTQLDWLLTESRRLLALPAPGGAGAK
ncbi:MAG: redoxin domain-containing protein [Planctomycetes bacterium]|nr:redoxin domain-containing protein [Planctomycetota bacterium]MCB9885487.1 redoxin domain-containing protein [Planctomycetota bacterium]